MSILTPDQVLLETGPGLPLIPACEHIAGNEQFILKALELQRERKCLFDLTCDLEDGTPAGHERDHLQLVTQLLQEQMITGQRVGVRIHGSENFYWQTEVQQLLAKLGGKLAYLSIPKVTGADSAKELIKFIQGQAERLGIACPRIHLIIENHGALRDVWQLAALEAVDSLVFGIMDFVSAHRGVIPSSAMQSPLQFEHKLILRAKAEVCAAAAAYGKIACHNVTLNVLDPETAFADAQRARTEFGFMRMWSIHPVQIDPILRALAPDSAELADAESILLQAQCANWAPIRYKDTLYDRASYRYYWDLLRRAKQSGAFISEPAMTALFSSKALISSKDR